MVEKCSYCGEEGHSIQQCPKWKLLYGATTTSTELQPIIYWGVADSRNIFPSPLWLPADAVKLFWDAYFMPKWTPEEFAQIALSGHGIEEVGGSVHLPAEHLGPIEKQGKYSKIYKSRYSNVYFVPVYYEYDRERSVKFVPLKVGAAEPLLSSEQLPPHAGRAYSLSGGVLPEPRYNVSVNNTWIGSYKKLEAYPWLGAIFFPTNWKTKQDAIAHAKAIIQGTERLPDYMGKVDMAKATVEVVECFGSYPQDRATIWQNGKETYIYEA